MMEERKTYYLMVADKGEVFVYTISAPDRVFAEEYASDLLKAEHGERFAIENPNLFQLQEKGSENS